jgi:hypothetical protein
MRRLRLAAAPMRFAFRRMRARPLSVVGLVLAFAGAAGLIGWSSLTAALSQEDNVRRHLQERAPGTRSLQVLYFTLPLEGDFRAASVDATFSEFAAVTAPPRHIQIWHSIEPGNPRGTRLVVAREPRHAVLARAGRLPRGCNGSVCEALALKPGTRLGARVPLGGGLSALIVGTGSLRRGVLPDPSQLGDRPLFVRELTKPLEQLVLEHGSTVVTSAALDARRVRGYALPDLSGRLHDAITRLERGDPLVRATAPLALLDDLAHRGNVARGRLLLVAGEGAALILAFAAFLAAARRREMQLVDDQLTLLGASRLQARFARIAEVLAPSLAGSALALAALWIAAFALAGERDLPSGFVGAALPLGTLLVIAGVSLVGSALLFASFAVPQRQRFGIGALELAAVTALGVVVWQAATTGALDPERVASSEADPLLLLAPALAFFATAVLLLRLLPFALRLGERLTRRSPFGVRLAFLSAARNPGQVAAATTFLAVALGASLFSLDYRATLDHQSRDQARFAAGAEWRAVGRDVTPLTRFARVTGEKTTPVLRLGGAVEDVQPASDLLATRVLALAAERLPDVLGWRDGFSELSRAEIARRLRPAPVRLGGPRLAADVREVRVWARAQTDYPRDIVLHLLAPGQRFADVRLGRVWRRWQLLRATVRGELRSAELIGIEFVPTFVPISFQYDPKGFVDLGGLEQRRAGDWSPLPSLENWRESTAPTGTSGILTRASFTDAPIADGLRFELAGTFQPLIHPSFGLPDPRPGFVTGDVPALAGGPVAARAVDELLTLEVEGKRLPVRVIGRADLFPTVVERPSSFLVFDYDTLFAALNADQPGLVHASEAWFFKGAEPNVAGLQTVSLAQLTANLEDDPLAAGTREVLGISGIVAAVLGLLGLALATRSALSSERLQLAEYEALGVPPRSLRRSAQVRLFAVSMFGVVAGVIGALLGLRLIAAFVAVTGTAKRPLPPIESVIAWSALIGVVAAVVLAGLAAAAMLTRRALHETPAGRLRA